MSEVHNTCKDSAGIYTQVRKCLPGELLELFSLTQDVFQLYFSTSE